jgi:signal peptidase II
VIPHFWSNRYAENPGAAWSMLASAPESVRDPFFRIVSVVALCLIAFYYSRLRPGQGLLGVALSLVMGGAIGNLIDRFVRSYVIDFIDWHVNDAEWRKLWDWPSIEWTNHGLGFTWVKMHPHWPTFNIADTGISVGVALIALDTLLVWWAQRRTDHTEPLSAGT